jgi:stage V sporulation protein SpoVS
MKQAGHCSQPSASKKGKAELVLTLQAIWPLLVLIGLFSVMTGWIGAAPIAVAGPLALLAIPRKWRMLFTLTGVAFLLVAATKLVKCAANGTECNIHALPAAIASALLFLGISVFVFSGLIFLGGVVYDLNASRRVAGIVRKLRLLAINDSKARTLLEELVRYGSTASKYDARGAMRYVDSEDSMIRVAALHALAFGPSGQELLDRCLAMMEDDRSEAVRLAAVFCVSMCSDTGNPRVAGALAGVVRRAQETPAVRAGAYEALHAVCGIKYAKSRRVNDRHSIESQIDWSFVDGVPPSAKS